MIRKEKSTFSMLAVLLAVMWTFPSPRSVKGCPTGVPRGFTDQLLLEKIQDNRT